MIKLSQFDLGEFEQKLKLMASTFIVREEPIPTKMDLWRLNQHLCTITLPQVESTDTEKTWSRVSYAPSLFGATHSIFSHPANISVTSPTNPTAEPTPCLCIYCVSVVQVHQSVFPYSLEAGKDIVSWQENAEDFNAIKEYPPLATFLSISSVFTSSIGNPQRYHTWLVDLGYDITFHQPFNDRNFAFFPKMYT